MVQKHQLSPYTLFNISVDILFQTVVGWTDANVKLFPDILLVLGDFAGEIWQSDITLGSKNA